MNNLFRDSFNTLLDTFGDKDLGVYYVDKSNATHNSYGEITGGVVYLVKRCSMRGKVVTDPLEVKTVTDESASYIEWDTLTSPAVFKCSITDLIKGGIVDSLGNYEAAKNPYDDGVVTGGLLNMYLIWHGEIYDILAIQKGIVYQGNPTALYLTCSAVYDKSSISGRADLEIIGGSVDPGPVDPPPVDPDPPEPTTKYTVYVDNRVYGQYAAGDTVVLTVPSKEGFVFTGWTGEVDFKGNTFTMPDHDVYITANWTEATTPTPGGKTYYVTVVNESTATDSTKGLQEIEPYQMDDGSYAEPSLIIKAGSYYGGHDFSEWRVTEGSGTFLNSKDKDTIFYPTTEYTTIECVWTEVLDPRPTVTYIGVDGKSVEHVDVGKVVYLSAGTKEGHTFTKWTVEPAIKLAYVDTSLNNNFTMPDFNVTVTAGWVESDHLFNVVFHGYDGVFQTVPTKVREHPTDPGTPERENYEFNGWYTAAEGGTAVTLSTLLVVEDVDLYAHWIGAWKTVTFDTDGGSTVPARQVRYGDRLGELPEVTKASAEFVRWVDEDGEEVTADTVVFKDMTVKAEWKAGVSEEVTHIKATPEARNFCVASFRATVNWTTGTVSSTVPTQSNPFDKRGKLHFYLADWGLNTPDEKYTTPITDLIPGTEYPYSTIKYETRCNVYSKIPPTQLTQNALTAGEFTGQPFVTPDGAAVCTPTGYVHCLMVTIICNDAGGNAVYLDNDWGNGMYAILAAKDIGEGWYRYEIAYLKNIKRAAVIDRMSKITTFSTYTDFNFPADLTED